MWSEIQNAFEGYFQSTTSSIPSIVNALIILIIGWTLAKVIQWIVFKLSHALGIDRLAQKSGVHRFLEKRGIKKRLFRTYIFHLFLDDYLNRNG
ncbi:MAG: hypothetical protein IPL31_12245 [Saprospiraceae bacterium]|nr:hypothetical protein [Saprospiraceae bacterium]